jgi:glycosyltransferase involved in cell wall biosynthesis
MYCRRQGQAQLSEHQGVRLVYLPAVDTKQLSTLSHGFLAALASRYRGYDVVLAVNVANVPFCIVSRLSGQRLVLNTDGQEWLRGKWGTVARAYFRWCAGHAAWGASALISDCYEMKRIYATEFRADSTVIPYPSAPLARADRQNLLADTGVRPREFVVVAARLNPENNVHHIAEAYSRSGLTFPLLVLGAANYRSSAGREIQRLADQDDRIRPLGHVGDRDVFAALLSEARAYVHGHSVGGMNPSLVEAMSAGALIFALDTVFNREVLGAGGIYFDLGSDLVERLDALAAPDGGGVEAYRELAATRARERYSLNAVADAYELVLTQVAGLTSARRSVHLQTAWDESPD